MRASRISLALRLAVVSSSIALLVALSACGRTDINLGDKPGEDPESTLTSKPTDEPSEQPTDEPTDEPPTMDSTVLFTITATASRADGASAELKQVVYKPVATTDQQAADTAALDDPDGQCGVWHSAISSANYIVSIGTAVDTSPAGKSWAVASDPGYIEPPAIMDLTGFPIYTGDFYAYQAYCSSIQLKIGSVRAVTPVNAAGADQPYGWANVVYGFNEEGGDEGGETQVTLSNCTIVLSDYAKSSSAIAAGWPTQTQLYPGLSCSFGVAS